MARSIVLGNGEILVGIDRFAQVRDFYFPYVGSENHTSDCIHKIGVWVDGVFSWLSDTGWNIKIDYEGETLVSHIQATNQTLGIELLFTDTVYNEQNIFLRKVKVKNTVPRERECRVFFHQQFQISGLSHGNTAYYDPELKGIVHYRGRRAFLVSGRGEEGAFNDYSVGLFHIEGKDGTWKDAEDGVLSKNPVEHGSVDSTISFNKRIKGGAETTMHYWIIASDSIYVLKGLHDYINLKTPDYLIQTTSNYWNAWISKLDIDVSGLDKKLLRLFKRSLLIMRTHVDNRGAILASGDSDMLQYGRDSYSYVWPRDGAFIAMAFDRAGYFEATRHFFEFCVEVMSDEGYLHHKYRPDQSLGSSWHPWVHNGKKQLAIQEDETALPLIALWHHYELHKDLEHIEKVYNPFIKRAADFLYFYRDETTNLPYGSYDLWEEKFGTSTFTAATVYQALMVASKFAKILGKKKDATRYQSGAIAIQQAIGKHLYNEKRGYFIKLIDYRYKEPLVDETLDTSSFYGLFKFGVFLPQDEKLRTSYKTLTEGLNCEANKNKTGGIIRYEGDQYLLKYKNLPGNPWIITTLWVAQYEIAQAKTVADLQKVEEKLHWVCENALQSGILSEQVDPYTGEHISVSPLTWSHAEYVTTVLDFLEKQATLKR